MIYDESEELQGYVIQFQTLTDDAELERIEAEFHRAKQAVRDWSRERAERQNGGQSAPQWKPADPSSDYAAFLKDVVDRVLRENQLAAVINRCPECHSVLRTPKAKLCLWCGHSQYSA
jgi:hypothetical protein